MTGLFEPEYHGELSEIDLDPRLVELVIRQHKASVAFSARQSQEYVRLALVIRRETTNQQPKEPTPMTQLRNLTVKRGQSDVLLFCGECGSIIDNVEGHPLDDIVEVAQTHVDLHNVAVTRDDT